MLIRRFILFTTLFYSVFSYAMATTPAPAGSSITFSCTYQEKQNIINANNGTLFKCKYGGQVVILQRNGVVCMGSNEVHRVKNTCEVNPSNWVLYTNSFRQICHGSAEDCSVMLFE